MNDHAFLCSTTYCDCHHPDIQRLAKSIMVKGDTQRKTAVRLFYWVRDQIKYRVGLWNYRASETLEIGKGTCTNKANLLVALLRAVGIPAGYCVMTVKGREYLGPIVLPMFENRIARTSRHIYCCARVDGEWRRIDPSDDAEFVEQIGYFNPVACLVEWNGNHDALLNFDASHILHEDRRLPNIDPIIAKKPRNARGPILTTANIYIDFLRENQTRAQSRQHLQKLFIAWLKDRHYILYWLFHASAHYREWKEKWKADNASIYSANSYQEDFEKEN